MFVEGISFIDVKSFRHNGTSLWLDACRWASHSFKLILQRIIDAGCNVAEKDSEGQNCLFHGVNGSCYPEKSYDFEKLQYLLGVCDDIYATDAQGRTLFDHFDDIEDKYCGSYRRDLWYCALERAGIDVSSHLVQHPRVPSYTMERYEEYTPEHYHALKHLKSWDRFNFRSQMDRLLQEIPLDEDEALEMERLQRKKSEMDFDDESESDEESERVSEWESDDELEADMI
jgi:hypothetical protein